MQTNEYACVYVQDVFFWFVEFYKMKIKFIQELHLLNNSNKWVKLY